jgi:hypothetical protein
VITKFPDIIFRMKGWEFLDYALEVFDFQYHQNPVYRQYCDRLGVRPESVRQIGQIPFLPIRFFKTHWVRTTVFDPEIIFESSGTTGESRSRHGIKNLQLYQKSCTQGFESVYGPIQNYCILGLLPAYLERKDSSLVSMVSDFVQWSGHSLSGFYLNDHQALFESINHLERSGQKTLLLGVTFALLDFAEAFEMKLNHTLVMETGGMKGRRKELTRGEVHEQLMQRLGVGCIHSEYGMTELLSQAYSKGLGIFQTPPWMKVLVRAEDDPLEIRKGGHGMINVIDLANLYSCSFLATDDIGKLNEDGTFEIWGRQDFSDIRGCNLLVGELS